MSSDYPNAIANAIAESCIAEIELYILVFAAPLIIATFAFASVEIPPTYKVSAIFAEPDIVRSSNPIESRTILPVTFTLPVTNKSRPT